MMSEKLKPCEVCGGRNFEYEELSSSVPFGDGNLTLQQEVEYCLDCGAIQSELDDYRAEIDRLKKENEKLLESFAKSDRDELVEALKKSHKTLMVYIGYLKVVPYPGEDSLNYDCQKDADETRAIAEQVLARAEGKG